MKMMKTPCLLALLFLVALATTDARAQFEIRAFTGLRVGGSFTDYGYETNALLEDLDVAPGTQFGASLYIPVVSTSMNGRSTKIELLFNFQKSDLRFEPASISSVPDSITARFAVDGDRLILDEVKVQYAHIGVMQQFGNDSGWIPHVNFGLGATIFKTTDSDLEESKFSFHLGGGVTKMWSNTIGSRFQIRGYFTLLPSDNLWVDRFGGVWGAIDSNMFFQGEISAGLVFSL